MGQLRANMEGLTMAQISKRGNRWRVRIRRDGQEQSNSFSTKDAAERWARKTESEIESGLYLAPQETPHKILVKEAASAFISEHLPKLSDGNREKID